MNNAAWMDALVELVRSDLPDLTNRQMGIMLTVGLLPGPHTVRGLSGRLNVSKPVVTRALNKLTALGYLQRERDRRDGRNIFVHVTQAGAEFLERFNQLIGQTAGHQHANAS
jgi:DNA-binding MarR family transcriptional regulator